MSKVVALSLFILSACATTGVNQSFTKRDPAGTCEVTFACLPYVPSLPNEIDHDLTPVLVLGVSGRSLAHLPTDLSVFSPKAQDAITYPPSPHGIATIKVGNNLDYQTQDLKDGKAISQFKTRAEFSTIGAKDSTAYGEGDFRVYRTAIRLHTGWNWDDSIAIFTQFKRISAGPDMFLAVKNKNIVLRIGRNGAPNASQTTIISNVSLDEWIEIILSVNWSYSDAGNVKSFYRYSSEQSYHNVTAIPGKNLQDPSRASYLKFGIYKPDNFSSNSPSTAAQSLDIGNISIFRSSN